MPKINHIADFESLGGVQTYLYSLKKKYPNFYSLYKKEQFDIFADKMEGESKEVMRKLKTDVEVMILNG